MHDMIDTISLGYLIPDLVSLNFAIATRGYRAALHSMDQFVLELANLTRFLARDRCVAVLESGRLALVGGDVVQAGDHIAILHGLNVPCILRKAKTEGEWTFHGDTLVKGIMKGEGVTWAEDEADTIVLV